MSLRRSLFLSLAVLFAAGCSSGGGSRITPAPDTSSTAQGLAQSSAAQHILANVTTAARAPQSAHDDGDGDADDGGRGELVLPVLHDCGNGTFATDCGVWAWTQFPHGTRSGARAVQSVAVTGTPPVLNFCRDAASFPADLTAPPLALPGPVSFALSYTGTHALPVVSFATRWWNVSLQNTFAPASQVAPNITLTPVLANAASRGWLVFFTWSWPADVLLVPYAINEIQVGTPSPLVVPRNGNATLGAFDCLGRPIAASRYGTGFGFGADGHAATFTSAGPELNATVHGTTASGSILLHDDRGAGAVVPVTAGSPVPTPTPSPR